MEQILVVMFAAWGMADVATRVARKARTRLTRFIVTPGKSVPRLGVRLGRWSFYLWAGAWSIYDRNGLGNDLVSTERCQCHRFALYVGPLGLERRWDD